MTTTVANKVNEVETRFNALTSSQQQDAEVIDARDGETSLKARLDRDIEKTNQVYVNVEGSNISTDSSVGYLKDVEILGNTIQSASNLADIRSVGDKVEGQELYEIPVLSRGKNLFDGELFNGDGIVKQINGKYKSNKYYIDTTKRELILKPNTAYVFSIQNPSAINTTNLFVTAHFTVGGTTYSTGYWKNGINLSFQTDDTGIVEFVIGSGGFAIVDIEYDIQLEEGIVATPYEPYVEDKLTILSPVQLEKVGDVADRLIEKNGVWGVEKNIGTVVLDGESLRVSSLLGDTTGEYIRYHIPTVPVKTINVATINVLSNKLQATSQVIIDTLQQESISSHSGGGVQLKLNKAKGTTVTEINNYLKLNNIIVKYNGSSQFIPLPHDQQVKLRTFANKTNISFGCEIEGTIKAQVPKSLGATVNTHTEQINNLNNELNRVKKLEESTVSTVTTESDFTTVEATSNGYFEDVKLEGKTLVNLFTRRQTWNVGGSDLTTWSANIRVEVGKQYTLIVNGLNEAKANGEFYITGIGCSRLKNNSVFTPQTIVENYISNFFIYGKTDTVWTQEDANKIQVMILEGDHTQNPPSYFEGLKSVGQSASEDGVDEIVVSSVNENLFDDKWEIGGIADANGNDYVISTNLRSCYIRVKPNTSYKFSDGTVKSYKIYYYTNNKVYIKYNAQNSVNVGGFTTPETANYVRMQVLNNTTINNFQLEEGTVATQYTPHQSDKKRLLYYNEETQTWEKPILREWDSIEKHSDGKYYYHQRSGEVVLNGTHSTFNVSSIEDSEYIRWYKSINTIIPDAKIGGQIICDSFENKPYTELEKRTCEGIGLKAQSPCDLGITVLNTRYSATTGVELNSQLALKPITFIYQLAQEKVYECTNIDLITYANETNYVVESGAIVPKSTLKVHNNIANVVSLLQKKVSLLESNIKASQEVQDMMILETDMRMLDIELALMEFISMKLNLGGSDMLRSATYFNFLKNHIINETYEKEYLENVMNKYLATGRINQDEYDELYKMLYPPVYDIELPVEY